MANHLPVFFTPNRTKHRRKITKKQEREADARRKIEKMRYEKELQKLGEL